MSYDFTTLVPRTGTGASKWNEMLDCNPNTPPHIVPLSVADMELKNPPEVVEGLKHYLDTSILGYTSPTTAYYNAVTSWMKRRHNWDISPEWLVYTPGVVTAFYLAVSAFSKVGDGVIVMPPVYYPFYSAITQNGRTIVHNPLLFHKQKYTINYDELEELAQNPKNKLLLFCNPHNPVGRVWTKEELQRVGDICNRHQVLMLSDEIHNDLIMPGYRHTVYAALGQAYADRCIVFTSPSKTFNLAGLQCSNIIVPNATIRARYKEHIAATTAFSDLNMLAYKACELAYNKSEPWLEALMLHIQHNYNVVKTFMEVHFPQIDVLPMEGTYLVWMDFRKLGIEYKELERIMQQEALVFLDEGYIFGEEGIGFERMNIACPTNVLEAGLERLKQVFAAYL